MVKLSHAILVIDEGCNTLLMTAYSSKAHLATFCSLYLELYTPQSLATPTTLPAQDFAVSHPL